MTLTFDLEEQNLHTAHRLGMMKIHTNFDENRLKQTGDMARTRLWPNILSFTQGRAEL